MTVSTAQLFIQAVLEKPSVCIQSCCPLPHLALAVAYAYFMKSAAQRLGPTLAITWPQGALAVEDSLKEAAQVYGGVREWQECQDQEAVTPLQSPSPLHQRKPAR